VERQYLDVAVDTTTAQSSLFAPLRTKPDHRWIGPINLRELAASERTAFVSA
jgi:hypothetical protein